MLEKKWQYIIKHGDLKAMFDTSLTIGDEILQEVLGGNSDRYMHNIAATIQREQNRIIRHTKGRLLIVQGAAGSGKTSAAMQRIAYLLYRYRENLNADQIILFSPNSMFNSYVSSVLPELGEENMQQVTFQEYLDHRLKDKFQVEGPYDQLEYVLTASNEPSYDTRMAAIQFKASTDFFEAIKAYRQSLESKGMLFKNIKFRGETIISADEIEKRFYHHDTALRFHNRLEKLAEWINKRLNEMEKHEWSKPWVEEEVELLSNEEYHKVYTHLKKKSGLSEEESDDFVVKTKDIGRLIVRKKFRTLRKRINDFQFIHIKEIYKQLYKGGIESKWFEEMKPENGRIFAPILLR